jgi:hypothetical protein
MEGKQLYVTVIIADGWPLLEVSFSKKFGYVALVDCKNKAVTLEATS